MERDTVKPVPTSCTLEIWLSYFIEAKVKERYNERQVKIKVEQNPYKVTMHLGIEETH